MLRSRSHWLVRVTFLWMGLMLAMPMADKAEAASKTSSRQRVSSRHSTTTRTTLVRTTTGPSRTRNYSATRASARRARYYRAKAVAYARDMRAVETPLFKTDASGEQVPNIRAEAAII